MLDVENPLNSSNSFYLVMGTVAQLPSRNTFILSPPPSACPRRRPSAGPLPNVPRGISAWPLRRSRPVRSGRSSSPDRCCKQPAVRGRRVRRRCSAPSSRSPCCCCGRARRSWSPTAPRASSWALSYCSRCRRATGKPAAPGRCASGRSRRRSRSGSRAPDRRLQQSPPKLGSRHP